jgi:hypothetical protein
VVAKRRCVFTVTIRAIYRQLADDGHEVVARSDLWGLSSIPDAPMESRGFAICSRRVEIKSMAEPEAAHLECRCHIGGVIRGGRGISCQRALNHTTNSQATQRAILPAATKVDEAMKRGVATIGVSLIVAYVQSGLLPAIGAASLCQDPVMWQLPRALSAPARLRRRSLAHRGALPLYGVIFKLESDS